MRVPPAHTPARRRLVALAVAAALALIAGIAVGAGRGEEPGPPEAPAQRGAPPRVATGAAKKLSLRRQVGQLVVMRFNGTAPPAYVAEALKAGRAAGVILFKDNIASRR